MKKTAWLLLGVMVSTTLFAQQTSTQPQTTVPATSTNVPTTPTEKKKTAKPVKAKRAIVEPSVTLSSGKAVVTAKRVNVRAQATVNSESITQLNPGDSVQVLEQVNLDKFQPDEPRQWAKIAFPENADVWAHVSFIDRTNMTVISNKLKLRAGPGENYSVVGTAERGTKVREVLTDGNWMRISAPASTYAFIAAMYLQQEAPAESVPPPATTPIASRTTEPATTPPPAAEIAAPSTTTPSAEPESPADQSGANLMTTPAPSSLRAEPPVNEPPPPRIVSHEGIVKRTLSFQAPTDFELTDKETGKRINYLNSPTTNLNLGHYRGLRIVVTGEEGMDARWTNTPVITIKRIHVVE